MEIARVCESKAPRNNTFGPSGIIMPDQGSTESHPTRVLVVALVRCETSRLAAYSKS